MKNWFSNCFPLLYICLHCDEGCICWHSGGPDAPGFYVRAQHDCENNKKIIYLFYLKTHIASIFDMQINIKERVDVNQDGASLIIEASPPPPCPQIAKDVNVFHIWKTYYLLFSLLYLCLQCDEVFMTPRTPKN